MNNIQIRDYQPGDFQQLCAIFIRAVTMTASQHYSPQQIAAWAQIDESRWKEKLAKSQVRVAVINAKLNRPGFPGECFICELRLPDHRFRWKHNKLFLLLPEEY
ncbi:hypothetical protein MMN50_23100, partial [Escherichia coli]|nr:hypothetical protein [Escherichia coli]MCH4755675.1 hypothetical protein [Escherichia coli]MCH6278863.1 hypothetical protein [Escherichia coli]MCH6301659.1 hypothetical protein [Escherichia coli]MCH6324317.1 hypothetical protein [Escherichia coli]